MSNTCFKAPRHVFLTCCGTILTLLLAVQCTWTPTIKTLIHQSEEGNITLETSRQFKILPNHPQVLSESIIKQILQGLTHTQENGLLQELFISDSKPSPVFSSAQIAFLTPHLVDAFSKATPEELIAFRIPGQKEGAAQVRGEIAVFPPAIFLSTIQSFADYQGNPSKMASSSRNLQKHTTLMFSPEKAVLNPKETQRFMNLSSQDSWIAINYADLVPFSENALDKEARPTPSIQNHQLEGTSSAKNTLEQQLQDLRRKVDEQAEEIQRLQQATPK